MLSAVYEKAATRVNGVDIEILYHEPHAYNVDRMLESARSGVEYSAMHSARTGSNSSESPKCPPTIRLCAHPGLAAYSSRLGFFSKPSAEGHMDMPYYVTAHELAHQWWGLEIVTGDAQGDSMLSESFAQYSALLLVEHQLGPESARPFLISELMRYLRGPPRDPEGELPLYRVEGQDYIRYRKGTLAMYALRDYVGVDVVNRALRRFLAEYRFGSGRLPVTTDFLAILKNEVAPEHIALVEDLFERITLFDLSLERARVEPTDDGRYGVSIDVDARKFYADEVGNETKAPLDFPIDIGVFAAGPKYAKFETDDVIALEKRDIPSGRSTLEIVVDQRPVFVGIDPYHRFIDRVTQDNLRVVETLRSDGGRIN